jgi:hypothetical protein
MSDASKSASLWASPRRNTGRLVAYQLDLMRPAAAREALDKNNTAR